MTCGIALRSCRTKGSNDGQTKVSSANARVKSDALLLAGRRATAEVPRWQVVCRMGMTIRLVQEVLPPGE